MKNVIPVLLLVQFLVASACKDGLELSDVFDLKAPLTLTHWPGQRIAGGVAWQREEIERRSERWNRLIDFAKNNVKGWRLTSNSFIGDMVVSQKGVELIYTRGSKSVVIAITNQSGERKQYIKKSRKGELDFLIEKKV